MSLPLPAYILTGALNDVRPTGHCGFSHVPDDAIGPPPPGFSRDLPFPHPFIPALLHTRLNHSHGSVIGKGDTGSFPGESTPRILYVGNGNRDGIAGRWNFLVVLPFSLPLHSRTDAYSPRFNIARFLGPRRQEPPKPLKSIPKSISSLMGLSRVVDFFFNVSAVIRERYLNDCSSVRYRSLMLVTATAKMSEKKSTTRLAPKSLEIDDNVREILLTVHSKAHCAYKERKSCKETCVTAERNWAAMACDWSHDYLPKLQGHARVMRAAAMRAWKPLLLALLVLLSGAVPRGVQRVRVGVVVPHSMFRLRHYRGAVTSTLAALQKARPPYAFVSRFDLQPEIVMVRPKSSPTERLGSVKGDTATHIKSHIAAKRKAQNWRAVFSSCCVYLWDFQRIATSVPNEDIVVKDGSSNDPRANSKLSSIATSIPNADIVIKVGSSNDPRANSKLSSIATSVPNADIVVKVGSSNDPRANSKLSSKATSIPNADIVVKVHFKSAHFTNRSARHCYQINKPDIIPTEGNGEPLRPAFATDAAHLGPEGGLGDGTNRYKVTRGGNESFNSADGKSRAPEIVAVPLRGTPNFRPHTFCRPGAVMHGPGGTGYPRENPPTSGIVRHDSHLRKSGSDPAGLFPPPGSERIASGTDKAFERERVVRHKKYKKKSPSRWARRGYLSPNTGLSHAPITPLDLAAARVR
ncbi:hypothetical protein PR048_032450 [Dryococelus australis]|uniref:Uncharacterized protein n=1 Tax=Dryococelus australis TaxID=614101 RepID=A0ABQ9G529_9NEOP|nr:hypothetical protein PR048_032450 [Dryococelus australis]